MMMSTQVLFECSLVSFLEEFRPNLTGYLWTIVVRGIPPSLYGRLCIRYFLADAEGLGHWPPIRVVFGVSYDFFMRNVLINS